MCQSEDYVYGLIDDSGLFAWISLDCIVVDLFYCYSKQRAAIVCSKHWYSFNLTNDTPHSDSSSCDGTVVRMQNP